MCECRDRNGEVIKIGDYVVGVRGTPLFNRIEGYVTAFKSYEYGDYIEISSPGGKTITKTGFSIEYEIRKH